MPGIPEGWLHAGSLRVRDLVRHSAFFSEAPWFDAEAVRNKALIDAYAVDGSLPGGLLVDVVRSWDWIARIAVHPDCNWCFREETLQRARSEIARTGYVRHFRAPNEHPVPPQYGYHAAYYRKYEEMEYGDRLAAVLDEIDRYSDLVQPHQDLILRNPPILRAEFRYLRKSTPHYVFEYLRNERKWRTRFEIFVPYQCSEVERLGSRSSAGRYDPLPSF